MGLALEVQIDPDTEEEKLSGIWDYRDDPEGIHYDFANSDKDRIENARKKKDYVDSLYSEKQKTRLNNLGFIIEPIEQNKDEKRREKK